MLGQRIDKVIDGGFGSNRGLGVQSLKVYNLNDPNDKLSFFNGVDKLSGDSAPPENHLREEIDLCHHSLFERQPPFLESSQNEPADIFNRDLSFVIIY